MVAHAYNHSTGEAEGRLWILGLHGETLDQTNKWKITTIIYYIYNINLRHNILTRGIDVYNKVTPIIYLIFGNCSTLIYYSLIVI
jgi:hypothetical protein